ncbi:MAG: ABC transporter permease subunit [Oscillospiraceae bacterium]|jgi:phosphonate transport system permease protein|nr:ABC transporter permease subunit [Oscillospiraceae bacterium]
MRVPLSPVSHKLRVTATALGVAAVFTGSAFFLKLDAVKFFSRLQNAGGVLRRFMTIDLSVVGAATAEMIGSLAMAVAALCIGFFISLVLAFLAAGNTAPSKPLAAVIKGSAAVVRAVPALVWLLMIVASVGFGNAGGLFGLLFPTCGYLIKAFITSIEDQGTGSVEAMRAVGASRIEIAIKGVLPGAMGQILAWSAMRVEFNVAESVNLGMVGVSGIGAMLMRALGKYQYGAISAIALVMLITMSALEILVNRLRRGIRGGK